MEKSPGYKEEELDKINDIIFYIDSYEGDKLNIRTLVEAFKIKNISRHWLNLPYASPSGFSHFNFLYKKKFTKASSLSSFVK